MLLNMPKRRMLKVIELDLVSDFLTSNPASVSFVPACYMFPLVFLKVSLDVFICFSKSLDAFCVL